jgi:hypothetical protein
VTGDGDTDPFIRTDEAAALENVRNHLAELEARVKVGDELRRATSATPATSAAADDGDDGGGEDPPPPPTPKKRTM